MQKLLILSLTFALGLSLAAPLAADKGAPKELPFYGSFTGGLFLETELDEEIVADRCPSTPDGKVVWAIASFWGDGIATHLGKTYVEANHCSYASPMPPDGIYMPDGTYGQGELAFFAANGDMLSATYANGVSLSPPPVVQFMDEISFTDGGTGRFRFASGGGVEMGSANLLDETFTLQMSGVISYKRR